MRKRCSNSLAKGSGTAAILVAAFGMLALVLAFMCAFPAKAQARFNEVAVSHPADQDLGSFDDPIRGSQLPDGTYKVTARTTSSMCIFYTNPANAQARDSKEYAILSVNGGKMTAVFYISPAYTHIYMGTEEEAAAATNADGTDDSNYIAGDPPEGYSPHLFTMEVPALNVPITFASYSGADQSGTRTILEGVWYTREVVFGMTTAEYEQIIMDNRAEQEQNQQDDSSNEGGSTVQPDANNQEQSQNPQVALETDNVNTSGGGSNGDGNGGSGNNAPEAVQNNANESKSEEASSASAAAPTDMRGVKMNIVSSEINLDIDSGDEDEEEEPEEETWALTPRQILGLSLVGLFALGIVARVIAFNVGLDRSMRPPAKPPAGEEGRGKAHAGTA